MNRIQPLILAALRAQLAGGKARPPEAAAPLWGAFNRLSRQRTWHTNGPNPITFTDIESYCRLMRLPLEPHHISILMEMDRIWIDHALASLRKKGDMGVVDGASARTITVELFDAMVG